jgi:hypothetical protein
LVLIDPKFDKETRVTVHIDGFVAIGSALMATGRLEGSAAEFMFQVRSSSNVVRDADAALSMQELRMERSDVLLIKPKPLPKGASSGKN